MGPCLKVNYKLLGISTLRGRSKDVPLCNDNLSSTNLKLNRHLNLATCEGKLESLATLPWGV